MNELLPIFQEIDCKTIIIIEDDIALIENHEAFFKLLSSKRDDLLEQAISYWNATKIDTDFIESLKKLNLDSIAAFRRDMSSDDTLINIVDQFSPDALFALGLNIPDNNETYLSLPSAYDDFKIRGFKSFEDYENAQSLFTETNKSAMTLFIIDEELGEGKIKGRDALKRIEDKDFDNASCLCTIYSSRLSDDPDTAVSNKQCKSFESSVITALFRVVLRRIRNHYIQSAKETEEISSCNFKNISYVLKRATNAQGYSYFDIINAWFDNAHSFFISSSSKRQEILPLTNIINKKPVVYIDPLQTKSAERILQICSHEAFDFFINNKQLPVMLGDIFQITKGTTEKFFLLLGQPCDITLRYDGENKLSRTSIFAELIEIEILDGNDIVDDKISFDIRQNAREIILRDFWEEKTKQLKKIKIVFSTKNMNLYSWDILDCCAFSDIGEASSNFSKNTLSEALGKRKIELIEKFKRAFSLISSLSSSADSTIREDNLKLLKEGSNGNFWEMFSDNYRAESDFNFHVTRLARIHEDYILFINRLYHEYRGRVAISSLRFLEKTRFSAGLKISIADIEIANLSCDFYRSNTVSLLKEDVMEQLASKQECASYIDVINAFTETEFTLSDSPQYTLAEKNCSEYTLCMAFRIEKTNCESHYIKKKLTLKNIFKNGSFGDKFMQNSTAISETEDIFQNLLSGTIVNDKYRIFLENGIVKVKNAAQ